MFAYVYLNVWIHTGLTCCAHSRSASFVGDAWPQDDPNLNLYEAARQFPQVAADLRKIVQIYYVGNQIPSHFTHHHLYKFARARKMRQKDEDAARASRVEAADEL